MHVAAAAAEFTPSLTSSRRRKLRCGCLSLDGCSHFLVRCTPGEEAHLFQIVATHLDPIVSSLATMLEERVERADARVRGLTSAFDRPATQCNAVAWRERPIAGHARVRLRRDRPDVASKQPRSRNGRCRSSCCCPSSPDAAPRHATCEAHRGPGVQRTQGQGVPEVSLAASTPGECDVVRASAPRSVGRRAPGGRPRRARHAGGGRGGTHHQH